MSLDLTQFHGIFFDEATEQLDAMEAGLRRLDLHRHAASELAELFRLAHSLKGGAATFGFPEVAQLARAAETVFAAGRDGRLRADEAVVEASLDALIVLRRQLLGRRDGRPVIEDAAEALARRLIALSEPAAAQETGHASGCGALPGGDVGMPVSQAATCIDRMFVLAEELDAAAAMLKAAVGRCAAVADGDVAGGTARLEGTIRELVRVLNGLDAAIAGLAFFPDGDALAADAASGAGLGDGLFVPVCNVPLSGSTKSAKIPVSHRARGRPLPKIRHAAIVDAGHAHELEEFWK